MLTKVLFSNPPWWGEKMPDGKYTAGIRAGSRWPFMMPVSSQPDNYVHGDYLPYPFFMAYATTYVAQNTNANVVFRDSIALRESYERWWAHLEQEQYDYLFFEIATPSWSHDFFLISELKSKFPSLKMVITGPIVLALSESMFQALRIHAAIKGEYEKGAVRVINGESGLVEYDMLSEQEMNQAPFPYYEQIYIDRYNDLNPIGQQFPHGQIWSSRGCPYKCIFCVFPATMTGNDPDGSAPRTVRHYSPEYIKGLVTLLKSQFGVKSIYFDDDTFNLGNAHVLAISEVMKDLNMPWSAMCRADTVSLTTWNVMKDSGCFGVKIGYESGSQRVIDHIINKRLDLKKAFDTTQYIKLLGIKVHGTFTIGLPGETKEEVPQTHDYIHSLGLDSFQLSGTAEIEGTPLHTLRIKGSLPSYTQADSTHENYIVESDGEKKKQQLKA